MHYNTKWEESFSGCFPIGYRLRENFGDRWFRIHHLENGKRYPDTQAEWEVCFDRHAEVLDAVMGDSIILIWCMYFDDPDQVSETGMLRFFGCHETEGYPWNYTDDVDPPDLVYDGLLRAPSIVKKNALIRIMLYKFYVDDSPHHLTFFSPETNSAYCPYDGGADIFLASQVEVDAMKTRFQSYLSERKDGL